MMVYFANRSNNLLEINISEGENFERLYSFLGKEWPLQGFPHRNTKTRKP